MLTQRSRYALRAMLFLATAPAGSPPIPMNRIAAEANVPRKFLELILADLREAGLLHSHRGKMGGYCLSRPTHLISLGEIIRVIEGPLALVPCVSRTAYRRCADCKRRGDLRDPPRDDARPRRDRADPRRHQPGRCDRRGSGRGLILRARFFSSSRISRSSTISAGSAGRLGAASRASASSGSPRAPSGR